MHIKREKLPVTFIRHSTSIATMAILRAASLLLTLAVTAYGNVALTEFFPYGLNAGDSRVPTADDNFVKITIRPGNEFQFFRNAYTEFFLNNNGGVSFLRGVPEFTPTCGPLSTPMVMPYWADVDTVLGGSVYYRQTTDSVMLQKARDECVRAFPGLNPQDINWMFLATWENVPFFGAQAANGSCGGLGRRNNFQLALVTDGNLSFAMFFYNTMAWTTGTASGGDCNGLNGTPAKAGFDVGDGVNFFTLPGTCSAGILDVTGTSNVEHEGKWIFRIDDTFVEPGVPQETTISYRPTEETMTSSPQETTTSFSPQETTTSFSPQETTMSFIPQETTTSFSPQETTTSISPQEMTTSSSLQEMTTSLSPTEETTMTSYSPFEETTTTSEHPAPIEAGSECDPGLCELVGHCTSYFTCDVRSRRRVSWECSEGLFWNPKKPKAPLGGIEESTTTWSPVAPSYGRQLFPFTSTSAPEEEECHGSCDVWENLPEDVKATYEADETCFPKCYYASLGECLPYYLFHAHNTERRQVEVLECPVDTRHGMNVPLVWVQERESCDFCYNAMRQPVSSSPSWSTAPAMGRSTRQTPSRSTAPAATGFTAPAMGRSTRQWGQTNSTSLYYDNQLTCCPKYDYNLIPAPTMVAVPTGRTLKGGKTSVAVEEGHNFDLKQKT